MAASLAGCSIRTTPRVTSGPIPPIARPRTLRCWRSTGWCRSSSARNRAAGRCHRTWPAACQEGVGSGRGRACPRRAEGPARLGHAHGRSGPGNGAARARHPHHQHDPPRLVCDPSGRGLISARSACPRAATPGPQIIAPPPSRSLPASLISSQSGFFEASDWFVGAGVDAGEAFVRRMTRNRPASKIWILVPERM
jgi:hypothetical protein